MSNDIFEHTLETDMYGSINPESEHLCTCPSL